MNFNNVCPPSDNDPVIWHRRHCCCAIHTALVYHNSLKYRCITNLMTMMFLGRSGRALLITLLLAMIISGVVHNLWSNTVRQDRR